VYGRINERTARAATTITDKTIVAVSHIHATIWNTSSGNKNSTTAGKTIAALMQVDPSPGWLMALSLQFAGAGASEEFRHFD
jgi:hypothetical protein